MRVLTYSATTHLLSASLLKSLVTLPNIQSSYTNTIIVILKVGIGSMAAAVIISHKSGVVCAHNTSDGNRTVEVNRC